MTQPNDLSQVFTCGVKECRMPSTCKLNGACVAGEMPAIESPTPAAIHPQPVDSKLVDATPAEARGEVRWTLVQGKYGSAADMVAWNDGEYVLHSDYATLARQLAEMTDKANTLGDGFLEARHAQQQAEAQLAQATARLAEVEGLPAKWRHEAAITRSEAAKLGPDELISAVSMNDQADTQDDCADELDAALQPKELEHE